MPGRKVHPGCWLVLLWAAACASCGPDEPIPKPPTAGAGAPVAASRDAGPARVLSPALGPRPAVAADAEEVAAIRAFFSGDGRRLACGPYVLWTDVEDGALLAALDALARQLDAEYAARLGIEPVGQARETVVMFASLRAFQRWESQARTSGHGYAGHASAARGLVVLYADRPANDVAATVVHELAHLVHRRALGSPLPRWLSEGLADALGDSATVQGFLPLDGACGVEGEMRRLRSGLHAKHLGSLAGLIDKGAGEFDRSEPGVPSYDYEHSALFVRYLLADPGLAPRFRSHLRALAAGGRWQAEDFWRALEAEPDAVDADFRAWLESL